MNGFAFPVTVNGQPQTPLDVGGRPANLFTPWMIEHLVQALGRLADGGDNRATFADGVLRVVTPSGNVAEMVVPLPKESFEQAGRTTAFYEGARDLLRSAFSHEPMAQEPSRYATEFSQAEPQEPLITLTVHNPDNIGFRHVVADAVGALGIRHRGARPTVETVGSVAAEFVVDLREAERVFVRPAQTGDVSPVVFEWRRAIYADELAGMNVQQ